MSFNEKNGFYWRENDRIPLCPLCKEVNNLEVHLTHNPNNSSEGKVLFECKNCKNDFEVSRQELNID